MKNILFLSSVIMSSFSTLFFFLLLTKEVSVLSGEETVFQALNLGVYLLAIGLGVYQQSEIKDSLKSIIRFEIATLILGAGSLIILYLFLLINMSLNKRIAFSPTEINFILLAIPSITVSFFLGFFSGKQLPLFLNFFPEKRNIILFLNYFGALIAGPSLNFLTTKTQYLSMYGIAISLLTISFLLIIQFSKINFFLLIASAFLCIWPNLETFHKIKVSFLASYYYGIKVERVNEIFSLYKKPKTIGGIEIFNGPYQQIDIVKENPITGGSFNGNYSLYLNGRPQFDLLSVSSYHESMIYGAFNISQNDNIKDILILGAGDGILLNKLRKINKNFNITLVELDPLILSLSSTHPFLTKINEDIFHSLSSNISIISSDGFDYIRRNTKKYDAIFLDFPFPYSDEIIPLYSLEFYQVISKRLNSNGFIILDFPIIPKDETLNKDYLMPYRVKESLKRAGISNTFSFGPYNSFIYAQVEEKKLSFNYQKLPNNISLSTAINLVSLEHLFDNTTKVKPFSLFYGN